MSIRVTHVAPSPTGGVSQQPSHQRLASNVSAADNAKFDVAVGVLKRAGTVFDRKFTATGCSNLRTEILKYSATERYEVVYGAGVLRVFRVGGNECAVTIAGACTTYLALNTATADQIRVCPIADYALLLNTTVNVALATSATYSVDRHRTDYDALLAYTSTTNYYLQTDADTGAQSKGFYQYTPGAYTYGHCNFITLVGDWVNAAGYWQASARVPSGFRMAFRRVALAGFTAATYTAATGVLVKTGAFTSYTFRTGDMIYITAGTGWTAGWFRIASRDSNDQITLILGQAGQAGADNADTEASDSSTVARIGLQVEVAQDVTDLTDMHQIAAAFQTALRSAGAANACVAFVPQGQGGAMQITGPWRGNNATVYPPTAPTAAGVYDLSQANAPFDGGATCIVFAGTGGAAPDADDTAAPEARWTRVAAPNQPSAIFNTATIPCKLTRTAANTFSVDPVAWESRLSGDATSNPGPKLFTQGAAIKDATIYRGRLFVVGGSFVAGSVANDHNKWFIANAANIVDSDPIDRTLPGEHSADILYAASFRQVLVLFTSGGFQCELSAADVLTPASAKLDVTTRYQTGDVRPRVGPSQLYFTVDRGSYSAVYEYFYDELRLTTDAQEVTWQCQTYVPAPLRTLLVNANSHIVLALPTATNGGYTISAYGYFWDGSKKLQSAWGRYVFDTGYRICDIAGLDNDVWMLSETTAPVSIGISAAGTSIVTSTAHGKSNGDTVIFDSSTTDVSVNGSHVIGGVTANTYTISATNTTAGTARWCTGDYIFEKLSLTSQTAASGWAYPIHMDRQLTLTGVHSAGVTTWTLPATPTVLSGSSQLDGRGSTLNTIVLGPAFGASSGNTVSIATYTGTTVTATGDYSAGACVLGRYFTYQVDLSRPYLRDGQGQPDLRNALQIESVAAAHLDTCSYSLVATQSLRTTRTRTYDNTNTPASGVFKTSLAGDADAMAISIQDSSPRPCKISGVQYELELSPDGITLGR